MVALRKESVDRNYAMQVVVVVVDASLSARRAWIEITYVILLPRCQVVALRKESVDRNNPLKAFVILPKVALRKESVDRNYKERPGQKARPSRSPQGERG